MYTPPCEQSLKGSVQCPDVHLLNLLDQKKTLLLVINECQTQRQKHFLRLIGVCVFFRYYYALKQLLVSQIEFLYTDQLKDFQFGISPSLSIH